MIEQYAEVARLHRLPPEISEIDQRFRQLTLDKERTARWVGFCQGYMLCAGLFSLEELKEHSRNASVFTILSIQHDQH
jgi:hypothetical protein